jgi:type IV pilus assembly protein PilE
MTRQNGFTLIELMIVVIIIGVLAMVAWPSYRNYMVKSNRADAESFMMTVASREEQYMLDKRIYDTLSNVGLTPTSNVAKNYNISVTTPITSNPAPCSVPAVGVPSYVITASAIGSVQPAGETLTLDNTGCKSPPNLWNG